MWIKTTVFTTNGDPLPRRLNLNELSKPVEFSDNGKANVPEADAQYLLENYDRFEPVATDDDDGDDEADADTDDAAADADDGEVAVETAATEETTNDGS